MKHAPEVRFKTISDGEAYLRGDTSRGLKRGDSGFRKAPFALVDVHHNSLFKYPACKLNFMKNEPRFVWVPEAPKIPGYYAAKAPVMLGKLGEKGTELGTYDIHDAHQFASRDECEKWIADNSPPEWEATGHIFGQEAEFTETTPIKYRKKPVVIEAIQFIETSRTARKFGESVDHNYAEIARFIGKPIHVRSIPNGRFHGRTVIEIGTLEGVMMADVGDWIIKGVKGEFYPCKPDIFEATYEPAV